MLFASIVDEVPPTALDSYREGFVNSNTHFIDYHTVKLDKSFSTVSYTRAEFWTLSSKFAALLRQDYGLNRNDAVVHLFNSNEIHDLSLRLASVMVGTIPVTINWQADTKERMLYKITKTSAKLVVLGRDYNEEVVDYLKSKTSELELDVAFVDLQTIDIEETPPLEESLFTPQTSNDSTRIIIFTSGTTGEPKGVKLSYNAYKTNRETFDGLHQKALSPLSQTHCPHKFHINHRLGVTKAQCSPPPPGPLHNSILEAFVHDRHEFESPRHRSSRPTCLCAH